MLSVPARATATSRLPIAVEIADRDRGRVSAAGIDECAGRGGGLERPVAGPQVDAVRGHDVEDAVVGEVADGDRHVTGPLEVGGSATV